MLPTQVPVIESSDDQDPIVTCTPEQAPVQVIDGNTDGKNSHASTVNKKTNVSISVSDVSLLPVTTDTSHTTNIPATGTAHQITSDTIEGGSTSIQSICDQLSPSTGVAGEPHSHHTVPQQQHQQHQPHYIPMHKESEDPDHIMERYKTELCRSFLANTECKWGALCKYAHGYEELRSRTYHGKFKTVYCRQYHQKKYCPFGSRCNFIHDDYRIIGDDKVYLVSPCENIVRVEKSYVPRHVVAATLQQQQQQQQQQHHRSRGSYHDGNKHDSATHLTTSSHNSHDSHTKAVDHGIISLVTTTISDHEDRGDDDDDDDNDRVVDDNSAINNGDGDSDNSLTTPSSQTVSSTTMDIKGPHSIVTTHSNPKTRGPSPSTSPLVSTESKKPFKQQRPGNVPPDITISSAAMPITRPHDEKHKIDRHGALSITPTPSSSLSPSDHQHGNHYNTTTTPAITHRAGSGHSAQHPHHKSRQSVSSQIEVVISSFSPQSFIIGQAIEPGVTLAPANVNSLSYTMERGIPTPSSMVVHSPFNIRGGSSHTTTATATAMGDDSGHALLTTPSSSPSSSIECPVGSHPHDPDGPAASAVFHQHHQSARNKRRVRITNSADSSGDTTTTTAPNTTTTTTTTTMNTLSVISTDQVSSAGSLPSSAETSPRSDSVPNLSTPTTSPVATSTIISATVVQPSSDTSHHQPRDNNLSSYSQSPNTSPSPSPSISGAVVSGGASTPTPSVHGDHFHRHHQQPQLQHRQQYSTTHYQHRPETTSSGSARPHRHHHHSHYHHHQHYPSHRTNRRRFVFGPDDVIAHHPQQQQRQYLQYHQPHHDSDSDTSAIICQTTEPLSPPSSSASIDDNVTGVTSHKTGVVQSSTHTTAVTTPTTTPKQPKSSKLQQRHKSGRLSPPSQPLSRMYCEDSSYHAHPEYHGNITTVTTPSSHYGMHHSRTVPIDGSDTTLAIAEHRHGEHYGHDNVSYYPYHRHQHTPHAHAMRQFSHRNNSDGYMNHNSSSSNNHPVHPPHYPPRYYHHPHHHQQPTYYSHSHRYQHQHHQSYHHPNYHRHQLQQRQKHQQQQRHHYPSTEGAVIDMDGQSSTNVAMLSSTADNKTLDHVVGQDMTGMDNNSDPDSTLAFVCENESSTQSSSIPDTISQHEDSIDDDDSADDDDDDDDDSADHITGNGNGSGSGSSSGSTNKSTLTYKSPVFYPLSMVASPHYLATTGRLLPPPPPPYRSTDGSGHGGRGSVASTLNPSPPSPGDHSEHPASQKHTAHPSGSDGKYSPSSSSPPPPPPVKASTHNEHSLTASSTAKDHNESHPMPILVGEPSP